MKYPFKLLQIFCRTICGHDWKSYNRHIVFIAYFPVFIYFY